jgi:hypothetical protein
MTALIIGQEATRGGVLTLSPSSRIWTEDRRSPLGMLGFLWRLRASLLFYRTVGSIPR